MLAPEELGRGLIGTPGAIVVSCTVNGPGVGRPKVANRDFYEANMKKPLSAYGSLLFVVLSFLTPLLHSGQSEVLVHVKNTSKVDRKREMVTVPWSEVRRLMPRLNPDCLAVCEVGRTEDEVVQGFDSNQDGTVDELLFLADFKIGEEKSFVLREADRQMGAVASLTDARFVRPREDIAWENDRIAFRMYGPALAQEVNNGIDVWTKRVRYLIVEKWYKANEGNTSGRDSYHEDHGEGADFFSVGRSLGCGGSALWKDDSLYQPGVFESYKIITTGPLRAVFELTYKSVQLEGRSIREVKRITLDAGQNLNRIDLYFFDGSNQGVLSFAAGVVKRRTTESHMNRENCWVSLYGPTTERPENGSLGTGVVLPRAAFMEAREDSSHILVIGRATIGKPVTYYAGAGWTRSGDFTSAQDWNSYLNTYALKLMTPLKVTLRKR